MGVGVLVGTRKGLFVLRALEDSRRRWKVEEPQLTGWEVMHATIDPRDGTMYAIANNWVYGSTVQRSRDGGATWERSEQIGFPESSELTVEKLWHLEPGHESQPQTFWVGGAPGVLFRSDDGVQTFSVVDGLTHHETRDRWNPGAGGLCCHSISLDRSNPDRMFSAISAAGAFRSDDGGTTWAPINKDVAADFLPEDVPRDVGQCVHKLHAHPEQPARLWQQNHCGVYRSDDAGETWERLDTNGLPSEFGFPIMLHPRDPDTAFVIPEEGAENRVTVEGRLGVYRTRDGGKTWTLSSTGLPEQAWSVILREAGSWDTRDPAGVYFGTQAGSVYVSPDEGEEWVEAARDLPPILSVEAVELA
jgi:photosystem II stability/assembly factor-like uncharacterized protein